MVVVVGGGGLPRDEVIYIRGGPKFGSRGDISTKVKGGCGVGVERLWPWPFPWQKWWEVLWSPLKYT